MQLREFIQCVDGTEEEVVCALVKTQLKSKKDGSPYLSLFLQDKTGELEVPIWTSYADYQAFVLPISVQVRLRISDGIAGRKNFRLNDFQISTVPVDSFYRRVDPKPYKDHLQKVLGSMSSAYQSLVLSVLENPVVRSRFLTWPAAITNHQNYESGLVFHTSNVTSWVEDFYDFYISQGFDLNRDLLLAGAILHDISKTVEYEREGLGWVKAQEVLPHPLQAISWIQQTNKTLTKSQESALCELILSHHGSHGAYPLRTMESYLLHLADNLDAQVHSPIHPSFGSSV